MSFTHEQLKQMGYSLQPDGTYSKQDTFSTHTERVSNAKPKHNPKQALEPLPQAKERSRERSFVRITRYSCRPLDIDNFAGGCKPLIDQLRYAGIIRDDNPEAIQVEFLQFKVAHKAQERTEVEIKQL